MKYYFVALLLLLLTVTDSRSQSIVKQYRRLPLTEKRWVQHHPYAAIRVFKFTTTVRKEVIEFSSKQLIDTLFNGGTADAFRHCYWMALCANKIGIRKALSLGEAHEMGNREQFEKGIEDDAVLQDSISCLMDLYNNKIGAEMSAEPSNKNVEILKKNILTKITEGKLRILRRNQQNQFTDCEGNVILKSKKKRQTWALPYCIIPSRISP